MKELIGVLLIICGIVLGVYLGVFVMFIGGIFQILHSISPFIANGVGYGILKIIFASFVGSISALVLIIPGKALLDS